jgi:type I restriction enzyme S subunit
VKMVPLGETLTFAGKAERIRKPADETFVTVRLNGGGAVKRHIKDGKTPVAFTGYRVRPGQFIYSRIDARNGAFALVPRELDGAVVSKDFPVFDVRADAVDARYLIHFLRAGRLQLQIRALSLGATNRQRITEDRFLAFKIPLPPLDDQRRIAAILDHADTLRAKRQQIASHLGDLAQSIFIEMFGDPVANLRGWPRVKLREVVPQIDSGSSPVCEGRPAQEEEWSVLKLGSVSYGTFDPTENKAFLGDTSSTRRAEVRAGDFLLSRKNTKELVGASVVVRDTPPRRLLPDLIFRLHLDSTRIDAEYLNALLRNRSKRPQVVSLASGSASSMANISQSRLLNLSIELPPLGLQRAFARRIQQLVTIKEQCRRLELEYTNVFASLQSRAFRGEL